MRFLTCERQRMCKNRRFKMRWDKKYQKIARAITRNPRLSNDDLAKALRIDSSRISRRLGVLRKHGLVGLWVDYQHSQFGLSNRSLVLIKVDPPKLRNHPLGFSGDNGFANFLMGKLFQTESFKQFADTAVINRAYGTTGNWDVVAILYTDSQVTQNDVVTEIRDKIDGVIATETMSLIRPREESAKTKANIKNINDCVNPTTAFAKKSY